MLLGILLSMLLLLNMFLLLWLLVSMFLLRCFLLLLRLLLLGILFENLLLLMLLLCYFFLLLINNWLLYLLLPCPQMMSILGLQIILLFFLWLLSYFRFPRGRLNHFLYLRLLPFPFIPLCLRIVFGCVVRRQYTLCWSISFFVLREKAHYRFDRRFRFPLLGRHLHV